MPAIAAAQTDDEMSLWMARRIVIAGNAAWTNSGDAVYRNSFHFTLDGFEFDANAPKRAKVHFIVDLKQLEAVSIKCHAPWQNNLSWCTLVNEAGRTLDKNGTGGIWYVYSWNWVDRIAPGAHDSCSAACGNAARLFAAALNRLRAYANDAKCPLRTFTQQAAAWRALATKPPLAEGARLRRLAAEDAIKNQKPFAALNYYELGVEADPMWAQGWFNAALVAGQLGYYDEAVDSMQHYLELMPDAPDAQSARDQMDLWRYKAGQQTPQSK